MKKAILLFTCLLTFCCTCFSQVYIGFTEEGLKKAVYKIEGAVKIGTEYSKGTKILKWNSIKTNNSFFVAFDDNDKSFLTCIQPKDTATMQSMLDVFNTYPRYLKISNTEWRVFENKKEFKIWLEYRADKPYVFYIKELL